MTEPKCIDPVFGEMNYKHRWYKKQDIKMFGKSWEIKVVAKAYSGKAITNEQQKSYELFMENEAKYIESIETELKKYINTNFKELAVNWVTARMIEKTSDLSAVVVPKTLLFKQDGATVMLMDCVWDVENGLGIKIIPEISIGIQDLFL